ncbi:MAG TPA: hypothetical protein ENK43_12220 [Planctomycetes bacterium]|nr:hypothetical protein [Planctomycetota bacterium]
MTLHDELREAEALLDRLEERSGAKPDSVTEDTPRNEDISPDVILVGIVGGTGVGKSSLVNALAGRKVTMTGARRPTTDRIVPYVHADHERLLQGVPALRPYLSTAPGIHDVETIRSLVLLDLPDMDGLIGRHADVVEAALPFLDIVIWMTSLTKYADRLFSDWMKRHSRTLDPSNLFFVLNKVDEISEPDPVRAASRLEEAFRARVTEVIQPLFSSFDVRDSCFTLSALHPEAAIPGNDFSTFKAALFRERTAREIQRIKSSNRIALARNRMSRAQARLKIEERAREIAKERAATRKDLISALNDSRMRHALESKLGRRRLVDSLTRDIYRRTLASWPVLPKFAFLLSPIASLAGNLRRLRHLTPGIDGGAPPSNEPLDALLTPLLFERRRRRSLVPAPCLAPVPTQLADLDGPMRRLESKIEAIVSPDSLADSPASRPSRARKVMIWGIILWFPLIQPLLEEILDPDGGTASLAVRLSWRLIRMTGAAHLLVSAAFVALVLLIILGFLRALAAKEARRRVLDAIRQQEFQEDVLRELESVVAPELGLEDNKLAEDRTLLDDIARRLRAMEEAIAP